MSMCSAPSDIGAIRAVLLTVDCNTRDFARLGYASLTSAHSPFQLALTALLTIYVMVLGYRLMFGGDLHLSDSPGIALKIGVILALVTNWTVFQTLVFDVASRAPLQIAAVIAAPMQNRSELARSPIDGLQSAYDQLANAANAFAKSSTAAETPSAQSIAATAVTDPNVSRAADTGETLQTAAKVIFIASTGLIAMATVAIGVLTAIGPFFVALFLFFETRGLFAGWVRALGAAAFALFSTWTLIVLMLDALDPWLEELTQEITSGHTDVQTAMTTASIVFVFTASQVGLIVIAAIVALGFRLAPRFPANTVLNRMAETADAGRAPHTLLSRPARLAEQLYQMPAAAAPIAHGSMSTVQAVSSGRGPAAAVYSGSDASQPGDWYRRPTVSRMPRHGVVR
jgi:type IV secretion system protein VirB6